MNGAEEVANIVNVAATTTAAHQDFSMFALFSQASITVKLVIILLIGCSFWSWTIIFAKASFIKKLKDKAGRFEEAFWNCGSVDNFFDGLSTKGNDPFVAVLASGMKEWRRSKSYVKSAIGVLSLKDRVESVMQVTLEREVGYLIQHIGFLATVGAIAPFLGLFGTIWGIMNCFEAIGMTQNTSLTAVAPGIAEALFTTALGLIVAIPANVGYNKISSEISKYRNRLDAFVEEFAVLVTRQMEDAG